jgi:hypothetical protein
MENKRGHIDSEESTVTVDHVVKEAKHSICWKPGTWARYVYLGGGGNNP